MLYIFSGVGLFFRSDYPLHAIKLIPAVILLFYKYSLLRYEVNMSAFSSCKLMTAKSRGNRIVNYILLMAWGLFFVLVITTPSID